MRMRKARSVNLTDEAWNKAKVEARRLGLSVSSYVELLIRAPPWVNKLQQLLSSSSVGGEKREEKILQVMPDEKS